MTDQTDKTDPYNKNPTETVFGMSYKDQNCFHTFVLPDISNNEVKIGIIKQKLIKSPCFFAPAPI